jgi:transcriptional regulator with XRE-family HTH domain
VIGVTLKNSSPPVPPPGEWLAVGERIVQARKRAGLEQRALAVQLGISARHLRNIEGGVTNPITWVAAISKATSVDADWIHHGGLVVMPGELAEAARALRESLAELRDDREVLVRTTRTVEQLSRTLEALIGLLADRLAPPRGPG